MLLLIITRLQLQFYFKVLGLLGLCIQEYIVKNIKNHKSIYDTQVQKLTLEFCGVVRSCLLMHHVSLIAK